MNRRLPAHVKWALRVLKANGYRGKAELGPDGRVKTVVWSPSLPKDEQHEGNDGEDDEDGPKHA